MEGRCKCGRKKVMRKENEEKKENNKDTQLKMM